MARKGGARRLVQEGIPLLTDQGRRVDFRVPVQKGGDNRWHIAGIAAKRAEKTAFLTNLARGGSVHPGPELLARHFGTLSDEDRRRNFPRRRPRGQDTPRALPAACRPRPRHRCRYPRPSVCHRSQPPRPQGALARSGQPCAFEALYKNPIAYARYVLEHGIRNAVRARTAAPPPPACGRKSEPAPHYATTIRPGCPLVSSPMIVASCRPSSLR